MKVKGTLTKNTKEAIVENYKTLMNYTLVFIVNSISYISVVSQLSLSKVVCSATRLVLPIH